MKELLKKEIEGENVCIFYQSGDRIFRVVGKVKTVDDNFVIVEDNRLGRCIVAVDKITKVDFLKNLDHIKNEKGGNK